MLADSSLDSSLTPLVFPRRRCYLLQLTAAVSLRQGCSLPAPHTGQAGQSRTWVATACSYCSARFSRWTWYFSASPNGSSMVWIQHKNTLILGCFLWVRCSGGENQTNYQQFSSSANHSPIKKFYWTQQFKNAACLQRVKALLLSPYFLGLAKNMSSFSSKTGGWGGGREGRLINTLRQAIQRLGLQSPSFITMFCQSDYWKAICSSGRTLKNIPILYHIPTSFSPVPYKCSPFLRKHTLKDRHSP